MTDDHAGEGREGFPPPLGTAQVAALLGVTVNDVRALTQRGKLLAYKLPEAGGYVHEDLRYFRDDVHDLARGRDRLIWPRAGPE